MTDGMRSLADILAGNLGELARKSDEAVRLTSRVRAALQGAERDHVLSASRAGDTLIVSMDSAAWCPHVHYQQDQLRTALTAQGETQFTKLKVRVGMAGDG